ncbi:DUF6498-containing protein [Haloplanus sp. GCM10025708]|uniref:DUF6498-containing protein n=1 Tax=Haloplanus sp. GCM10025708 TaxID=3252679 RepID=UPI003622E8BC
MADSGPRPRRPALLVLVVANSIPLVGVTVRAWDVAAVLLFYWLETGSAVCWAAVKALFAERGRASDWSPSLHGLSHKRGGVSVDRLGVAVYPRNLVAAFAAGALAVVWFGYGVAFSTAGDGGHWLGGDALVVGTVVVGVATAFVGRGLAFWTGYLGRSRYEDVTPGVSLREPLGYVVGLGGVLAVGPAAVSTRLGWAVAAVVAVRLAFAFVAHGRTSRGGSRGRSHRFSATGRARSTRSTCRRERRRSRPGPSRERSRSPGCSADSRIRGWSSPTRSSASSSVDSSRAATCARPP